MKDQIEKQAIEEMAKVIERTEQIARDAHCGLPSPTMYAKDLYWHGYRKQSEIVTEIVGIINKRIEINQYHLQGNNTDLFHGIYQGRYEAYRDIAEIIEQRYGAKMKGGAE